MLWKRWTNNQFWWFGLTAGFMVVSAVIVYAMAISQVWTIRGRLKAVDCLQIFIICRYIAVIKEPGKRMDDSDPCTLLLARLRYVETITENAPQLCLQVYIMLYQQYFPPLTVISSMLSLLALTWCIMVLEQEKRQGGFECKHASIFFCWQFLTLLSRESTIILSAYVIPYSLIPFIVLHLLIITAMVFRKEAIEWHSGEGSQTTSSLLVLSFKAAYPFLFHSAYNLLDLSTAHARAMMKQGYIILVLENIIIAISSLIIIWTPGVGDMDIVTAIAIGSFVAIILSSIPYRLYRRWTVITADLNFNPA